MGRVTFPAPTVQPLLERHFVTTYCNAFPGFSGSELRSGRTDLAPHFAAWWPSGTADSNVATVFATPDGEVLHFLRGFVRPEDFREEVEFALEVARAVREAGPEPAARDAAIQRLHRERRAELRRTYGEASEPIDTTRPPAPEAFAPDRYPHLLIGMHDDVIERADDVALLPTVAGKWDREASAEAPRQRFDGGDGVATPANPAPRPSPPPSPPPVTNAGADVGGVTNGGPPAQPSPSPSPSPSPAAPPPTLGRRGSGSGQPATPAPTGPGMDRGGGRLPGRRQGAPAPPPTGGAGATPAGAAAAAAGASASAVASLAGTAPTSRDLRDARTAFAAEQAVEEALDAFDPAEPGARRRQRRVVKALRETAPTSLYRLYAATRTERSGAAYAALMAATNRALGPDDAAWRALLEDVAASLTR